MSYKIQSYKMLRFAVKIIRLSLPSSSHDSHRTLYFKRFLFTSATVLKKYNVRKHQKFVDTIVVKKPKSVKKEVNIYSDMKVSELAGIIGVSASDVADVLLDVDPKSIGNIADDSQLDSAVSVKVATAFGLKPHLASRPKSEELKGSKEDDILPLPPPLEGECSRRDPVITIMGHVDHGKTTLLDRLRHSNIVAGEFGGITQHIGAFSAKIGSRSITFIDTPGHAAFAQMRQRGAQSTDIVVLVVAADDGVKDQTVESIRYAKEANVPIVVAINKCDRPNADPTAAKRSLLPHNVVVEDFFGDVLAVEISALTGANIEALKEAIILQADDMDLKSTWRGPVEGVVIESTTLKGIGKVCTMIVKRGTLTKNSVLVAGTSWAKIRLMTDENGKSVEKAGPSAAVRVAGWRGDLPTPGERVSEAENEHKAQKAINYRQRRLMEAKADEDWKAIEKKRTAEREEYLKNRQRMLERGQRYGSTLRSIVHKEHQLTKDAGSGTPAFKIILRSDVDGTLEAILNVLESYNSSRVNLQLVDFGVGPPTQRDLEYATETGATIICFNVSADTMIKELADKSDISIENYNVIYALVDSLKEHLSACLPDETELRLVGEGRVLKEFLISDRQRKRKPIAGTLVLWGVFNRNSIYRFMRKQTLLYEGPIDSMKRQDEIVSSVKTNEEVGLALADKSIRFKEDDTVEVYEEVKLRPVIDWNPPGF